MTGIDVSPNSDETDFDNDVTQGKSPIGALNPLMLEDGMYTSTFGAGYRLVSKSAPDSFITDM